MIQQDIYIDKYDWYITLFYNAKPRHTNHIMRVLRDCGVGAKPYYEARMILMSGRQNEGLTYNNPRTRSSVVVIGHVSDAWELIDTIEHEGRHLIQGICNTDHIDPSSEYAAYMEGFLFKKIIKNLVSYL